MRCVLSLFVVGWVTLSVHAQAVEQGWEVLYDSQTRVALKDAQFTGGTRRLTWLVTDDKPANPKTQILGPEFLEFREEKSTTYKDGIVTFIPVASLLRLEYEHDKKQVRVTVQQAGEKDLVLIGTTKFVGINKFNLEGTAGKAQVGVGGPLQFQDGLMKVPFAGFARKSAQPVEAPTGPAASVLSQDKEKTEHKVQGLTPLYKVGAGQKLASVLMFQKVGQIELSKIALLRQLPKADKKQTYSHDYEVTGLDGDKQKLTLLEDTQLDGNQKAMLIGLVGRVPAGFKLFPPHTIAEVRVEAK